ncbi:MAG: alpha-xylosidase [Chloroflexota bacterium]
MKATRHHLNFQLGGLLGPPPEKGNLQFIQTVISHIRDGNAILFRCRTDRGEEAGVRIQVCAPDILRLCLVPAGEQEGKKTLMVVRDRWEEVDFDVEEEPDSIWLKTTACSVRITKKLWELSVYDKDGNPLCSEHRADTDIRGNLRVKPLGYARGDNGRVEKVYESFRLAPDEHLYGLGEKFMPLDKRGQRIDAWNFNAWGTTNERSYKNVPFFMSTRGYGLFVNSSHRIIFDMGASVSSISCLIEAEDSRLDFYLIYGPQLKEILSKYTDITGRAPVPPKWSFGLWMSRASYRSREELESVAETLRRRDIPCDVLHLDPAWMREGKCADLVWDEMVFPYPAEMIANLKAKGFRLCLWLYPWISERSEAYQEAMGGGYFATKEDGFVYHFRPTWPRDAPLCGIMDFSHPGAVRWYQEKLRALLEMGVAAFKTDFGEAIPEDARFHNGMTGREMHNLYPLLYNRTVFEAVEGGSEKGIVWGRSGWAGSQRYPVCWSGDPFCNCPSLACTLWGGLNLGLSGVPFWSHDIGGFEGKPSPELYIRWAQFGLLSSHSRCHGTTPREPWEFGEEALRIFRKYDKLRYRLIPYLYSYAHVASRTGLPVLRAMVLEYQDDPNTHHLDLQYLLGQELLVAPIYDESSDRHVYLPEGKWIDYGTQKEYQGPVNVRYKAPLEVIPLFVKGDSVIPLGPEMSYVGEKDLDPLTLDVYLYRRARFTLYDDEETVNFEGRREGGDVTFEIDGSRKRYIVQFNKMGRPRTVEIEGRELQHHDAKRAFEEAEEGWWYDPMGRLLVRAQGGVTLKVKLR